MEKQYTNKDSYNNPINKLEKQLAEFTGAPYVVATDCCTHAIELCLRLNKVKKLKSSCYTYLSVPMTMKKLGIEVQWIDEMWIGEYNFIGTNIWDSARLLHPKTHSQELMVNLQTVLECCDRLHNVLGSRWHGMVI